MLGPLVEELMGSGIAKEDSGAICIFLPKQKVPLMIRKSDGGFNYDTTDLAALRYRIEELKCDRIVYITDIGQQFHFHSVFKAGELCGFYDPKKTKVEHMGFGLMK
jgi:arginyl-tRNA synthetase